MKNTYFKNLILLLTLVFVGTSINAQNITNYFPSDGLNEGGIYTIEEDHNGDMWFGSWTNPEGTPGLSKFDGTTWEQYTAIDDGIVGDHIRVVFEDSNNNLWIGTTTGISTYDGSSITNYTTAEGLVDDYVITIIQDTDGNIWVGTNGGVSKFDGTSWTNYSETDNFSLIWINSIIQDSNGEFWFGSGGRGVIKFDGVSTWTNYTSENSGLAANDVFTMHQDSNNNYWFGSYVGDGSLSFFDGTNWIVYGTDDGLPSARIRVITEDSFGDLWIGSNAGATKFDGYELTTYTPNEGLLQGGVRSFYQDSNDDLWVGTWASGISKVEISTISIPDGIFEKSLIQIGMDSDGIINGQVLRKDVFEVTELILTNPLSETNPLFHNELIDLDPLTERISNLTGIEAFVGLTKLGLSYSDLTSVDLSYNKELDDLFLGDNLLTDIDISKNTKLTRFGVMRNPNIGEVDVSNNTLLKELFLENTGITTIDLTNNLDLWKIRLENNNLTDLNISNNINLEELRCQSNNLTGVNASFNTKLTDINVRYNAPLTYLNLKNGNNNNITRFDITDTPNLTCVNADSLDVLPEGEEEGPEELLVSQLMFNYSGGLLSVDCGTVYIPDANFENYLETHDVNGIEVTLGDPSSIGDGVLNHLILRSEAESVGWLDVSNSEVGYGIKDLTGIEAFSNLTGINCSFNEIANLDFNSNTNLIAIYAGINDANSLDVSNCISLEQLFIDRNQISQLNLNNNQSLKVLIAYSNIISELDISAISSLETVHIGNNPLISLNIANGNNSNFVSVSWEDVSFNVSSSPSLSCIQVDSNIVDNIPNHWQKDAQAFYTADCSLESQYLNWGIAGNATPNGWIGPDIPFNKTDIGNVFEVVTDLTDGLIKFRADNDWLVGNYGDNGTDGTLNAPPNALDIPVFAGTYKIVMDLNNLTYSITPYIPALGVVGSATPGDWNNNNGIPDIVLTYNEDLNTWTGNANLTNGEIKFRYENDWSVNFGDDGLDNTLDPNGANIPVAEGFYFVRVDLNAMTYSLEDPYVSIPDSNFEQALIDLGIDGNIGDPIDGFILRSEADAVTDLNVNNKEIISLSGIEAFTNLSVLYCQYNQLQELNVTNNAALTILECEGNQLTELIVTQNPQLRVLGFGPNNLTEIDVSQNLLLEAIWTNGNNLTTINLDANTKLVVYGLSNNPYKYVSLKNGNNENVGYFEAVNTPSLDCINSDAIVSAQMSSSGKTFSEDCSTSIAGKWIIAPEPGALKVGPEPGSDLWWALNKYDDDIAVRGCYLDDVYEFNEDGSFNNILGFETWLEPWQAIPDQCGTPVAPHDGSVNASYVYDQLAGTITLNGQGAYLGLPKVVNGGELPNVPVPGTITYDVSFSENGNAMTIMIESNSGVFWTFKFLKESVFIPDANFEQALIDINIDSDGVINKRILRTDAESVTELNVGNPLFVSDSRRSNPLIENVTEKITDLTGIEAFINLTSLASWSNALTEIDVTQNILLEGLELVDNQITTIDVTKNTELTILWLESNALSTVDVSQNTKLLNLAVGINPLISLDVTKNVDLWALTTEVTQISEIDLSKNINLEQMWIADNPNLTKIDLYNNPLLRNLGIYNTSITTLDVSNNSLTRLWAYDSPNLTHLDLRNGKNIDLTDFLVGSTPNLTCINADGVGAPDISPAMINSGKTFSKDCGDFVNIPDPNFEQALIDIGIDSDGVVNMSILREDAEDPTVTSLNLNNSLFTPVGYGFNNPLITNVTGKIADLTGIEAFINLTNLQVSYSDLITINVDSNVLLQELWVTDGILENINVFFNTSLVRLGVNRNNISGTIDLSQNGLLEWLFINNNQISNLDINLNTSLTWLDAGYNSGISIITDPAGHPSLTSLNLSGIGLSNYNLYAPLFPNVQWLILNDNNLSSFNGNNALLVENLFLNNNNIDKLILNALELQIKQLHVNNNVLTELDLANGNNADLLTMNATGNLLTCIGVDNELDANNNVAPYNLWNVDFGVTYSINCKGAPEVVLIPDQNFEAALSLYDSNGMNGNILVTDAEVITILNVSNRNILDLAGIEAFINLTVLDVSQNLLNDINLIENTSLVELNVSNNNLSILQVFSGSNLQVLGARNNYLTSINLKDFKNLERLGLNNNLLMELDLRNNTGLSIMNADNNPNLLCIGVDDPNNIPTNWIKDITAEYSNDPDCIAPTIVAQDVTIYLDNKGDASVIASYFDNGSTDNVSANADLTFSLATTDFTCSDLGGPNVIELTVTDEVGNTAFQNVNLYVEDNIAPTVTASNPYTYDLNGMSGYTITPQDVVKSSSDNCGDPALSINESIFTSLGTYTVTLTADDGNGNTAEDTIDITIEDSASSTELKFKKNIVLTVFPVPFTDVININFSKPTDLNTVTVSLIDFNGNPTGIQFNPNNGNLMSEYTGALGSGAYVIQITVAGETKAATIMSGNN